MTQKKGEQKNEERSLDAGRLEMPRSPVGPEIQEEFREAQHLAGSGSQVLKRKLKEHTSTGPELSGGDIDADWENAENVGDEAVGDTQKDGEPLRTADERFSPGKRGSGCD